MRLGLAQLGFGTNKAHNLRLISGLARRAKAEGADLVVFPEFSMYEKKMVDATFSAAAEPLNGGFVSALSALASELRIAMVVGVVELNEADPRPFNTLIALGPAGELLASYRKIHLFDSYGFSESASISPAESLEPTVFAVDGMRVGLMTCYDLRFPELGRVLADAGAELVVTASSWVPGEHKAEQWRVLARARAVENSYFVAAVSQSVPISIGRSLLADPTGVVVGELGEATGLLTLDVNPQAVSRARERDAFLRHRRYAVTPLR